MPSDLLGCIRIDFSSTTTPNAAHDIRMQIYRALTGIPSGVAIQLIVGEHTPVVELEIPTGHKVQLVAPDALTYRRWLKAFAEAAS